jgi:hypothetical protein
MKIIFDFEILQDKNLSLGFILMYELNCTSPGACNKNLKPAIDIKGKRPMVTEGPKH